METKGGGAEKGRRKKGGGTEKERCMGDIEKRKGRDGMRRGRDIYHRFYHLMR